MSIPVLASSAFQLDSEGMRDDSFWRRFHHAATWALTAGTAWACSGGQSGIELGPSVVVGDGPNSAPICSADRDCERLVSKEDSWELILHSGYTGCGLRDGGQLYCWGAKWENVPALTLADVALWSEPAILCGIELDGELACAGGGHFANEVPNELPDGPFAQIVALEHVMCALRKNGGVACFDNEKQLEVEGGFTQISGSETQLCALASEGSIHCWRPEMPAEGVGTNSARDLRPTSETWDSGAAGTSPPTDVAFAQFDIGAGGGCGIVFDDSSEMAAPEGSVHCWGDIPAPPTGSFTDVAVGDGACGVHGDGKISCWGQSWEPRSSDFVSVHGGSVMCAIRDDGHFECDGSWEGETIP